MSRRRLEPYAYGALLILLASSLMLQLAADDESWSRFANVALQGLAVVAALRVSEASQWLVHVVAGIVGVALIGSLGVAIGAEGFDEGAARAVSLLLTLLAIAAVVLGIVRQVRHERSVTVRTMFGVLCVYLLVGMAFASTYGLIEAIGESAFFEQIARGNQSDFVYFSFATVTTTGWGDLTAAEGIGRSFAVTEALFGQIYLVTVVALIVSNLGRGRPGTAGPGAAR
jgi:hypothetical protein